MKYYEGKQKLQKAVEDAGIIVRLNERKWGRMWECDELLGLVDTFSGTSGPTPPTDPTGERDLSADQLELNRR